MCGYPDLDHTQHQFAESISGYLYAAGIDPKEYQDEIQEESRGRGGALEQFCHDLTAAAETESWIRSSGEKKRSSV